MIMAKAKHNMRKITFKKAVEQKFKEYDQKLKAFTLINVPKAIKEVVQAKVLTQIKKQLPTYVSTAIAKFVKPRLNNFVRKVMKNNQISLFTTPSPTTSDDLSEMKLKLKLLNRIKKRKKDAGEPSSRSSKKDKAPMVPFTEDTPTDQPQDQEEDYIQKHPNAV
ncbi:hypothetical protein Tco_1064597 [Tanacetum coccineum]